MLTLSDVKNYIRATDEDDNIVRGLIASADSYLTGAITGYSDRYTESSSFASLADLAKLQIIACWYEQREASSDIPATARLAITQLQLGGEQ